ncbi:MAG TPA: hypothetical protein VFS23_30795 [Vicinamibacterales bacterium]|nr:hypothetical protein [Vicinamibacterales bacterium]
MEFPHVVLARMYEHVEPIDRGVRYEDPLQEALEPKNLGRVTGGGSQLNELGGIEFGDVEIELADLDGAASLVVETLERAGAPQGSELINLSDSRVLREFGMQQCLAVFLDGTTLPDEVYQSLDFDAVVTEIGEAAGPNSFRGYWQGAEETGLFFGGSNADEMFARVEPVLRQLPIGQNARVVVRYGKSSMNPREVRMPRA